MRVSCVHRCVHGLAVRNRVADEPGAGVAQGVGTSGRQGAQHDPSVRSRLRPADRPRRRGWPRRCGGKSNRPPRALPSRYERRASSSQADAAEADRREPVDAGDSAAAEASGWQRRATGWRAPVAVRPGTPRPGPRHGWNENDFPRRTPSVGAPGDRTARAPAPRTVLVAHGSSCGRWPQSLPGRAHHSIPRAAHNDSSVECELRGLEPRLDLALTKALSADRRGRSYAARCPRTNEAITYAPRMIAMTQP